MGLLGGAAAVPAVRGQCRSTRPVSQAQAAISTRFRAAAARPASTSRAGPLHGLHCLQPVRGFGDDLDVVLGTQSHRESGARWRLCDAGAAPTRGSQRAPGWLRIRFRSRFGYIRMAVVPGTLLNSPARSPPGPGLPCPPSSERSPINRCGTGSAHLPRCRATPIRLPYDSVVGPSARPSHRARSRGHVRLPAGLLHGMRLRGHREPWQKSPHRLAEASRPQVDTRPVRLFDAAVVNSGSAEVATHPATLTKPRPLTRVFCKPGTEVVGSVGGRSPGVEARPPPHVRMRS